ncbi:hypothetical protein [Arthrobacter pityocampae]|uniref:hypothetical protein n=1 Tax=Arthrobacter pityocampae TaxID=547334 RepID=UPI00142E563B|nr:hypothetical protein [Arthrobacter pityocampae]
MVSFVLSYATTYGAQNRIGSPVGESAEVFHRDTLGDEEQSKLGTQAQEAAKSRKGRISPM